jgi:surface antigen
MGNKMQGNIFRGTAFAVSMSLLIGGCAVTPQDCQVNQTAKGALIGAGIGAAVGGIAAAASGLRSGAALGIAAGALLLGAAIGAAVGHHNDAVCHQMALQQALDDAMAANAAWQAREAERQQEESAAAAAQEAAQQQSSHRAPAIASTRPVQPSSPGPKPEYMTVGWANKMTNTQGEITPINTVAATTTDQVCMEFEDTTAVNGETKSATGKACRSADGKWNPV